MAEHELNKIVDDDGEVFNLRDSTKQPVADKVTSIRAASSATDTAYPSEKAVATAISTAAGNYVKYNDKILDTNPFGGNHLYLNYIGNAMYSMDKRYFVTVTRHNKVVDGVEYPRIKPGATVTDDVYYEDSPVASTIGDSSVRNIFDGNYESNISVTAGQYLKVHIQFSNEDNWSPATGRKSDYAYNYGVYMLSFYHANIPDSAKWRCYNTYTQHTVGWKQGNFGYYAGSSSSTNSVILSATDNANHYRTCIEFIIFPKDDIATQLTQIDWVLQRPTLSRTFPFFTNFADQNSYVDWYFKQKVNSNATIEIKGSDGSIKAKSLTLTDTPLPVSSGGTGKSSVTSNSFLVGNGTSALVEKTPSEVLSLIGGQAALTEMTTQEVTDFINDLGDL